MQFKRKTIPDLVLQVVKHNHLLTEQICDAREFINKMKSELEIKNRHIAALRARIETLQQQLLEKNNGTSTS